MFDSVPSVVSRKPIGVIFECGLFNDKQRIISGSFIHIFFSDAGDLQVGYPPSGEYFD